MVAQGVILSIKNQFFSAGTANAAVKLWQQHAKMLAHCAWR